MDGWHLDPVTLREVVDDPEALRERLVEASAADRLWLLRVLGHGAQAVEEGERLLAALAPDDDGWRLLLLLAHAHQWRGGFGRATELQDAAMVLASTPGRRAMTLQHTGKRLFDQGRVAEAHEAFAEALALREATGGDEVLLGSARQAVRRTGQLLGVPGLREGG